MASDMKHLRGKAACVGAATFGQGEAPGWNPLEMMGKASVMALEDAGVPIAEVDGVWAATAVHAMPGMSLAEHLGIVPTFSSGSNIGGSSFMSHALDAAIQLEAGLIDVALIAYGSNQRTAGGFRSASEPMPFEAQYELWARISCPTLLVRGTGSWASDPEQDGRASHFQNVTVANIENAGHWVHHDQLDEFLALTREFLAA